MSKLDLYEIEAVFDDCSESVGDDTALIYIMNYFIKKYNCHIGKHLTFYNFEKECFIEFNWDIIIKAKFEIKRCFKYYFNQKNQSKKECPKCDKYVNCKYTTNIYRTSDYLIIILNLKKIMIIK